MNHGVFRIRRAAFSDLTAMAVVEIVASTRFTDSSYPELAGHGPPAGYLERQLTIGAGWVAETGDRLLGFAVGRVEEGTIFYLAEIDVAPNAGRQGIGAALVEAVCTYAGQIGCTAVMLSTFVDVPWNRPWYERLGFVPVPESDLSERFQAIRRREAENGLDITRRTMMRRHAGSKEFGND